MWHEGRMVAYDCETTGTSTEDDRIVTAAVAFVGGGEPPETWSILVDPGIEIPEEATAVHGVSTERARAEGVPGADGVAAIIERLNRREPEWPLIMFQARFDATILDREARRCGLEPPSFFPIIDPLVIDKHIDRYRPGKRTLEVMCEHYRATLDGAHDADHDALAAARLAWRLGKAGQVIRRVRNNEEARELAGLRDEWERVRVDQQLLHAAQVQWAAFQAAGLEEYFRRGNPAKDLPPDPMAHVVREWPIEPIRLLSSEGR